MDGSGWASRVWASESDAHGVLLSASNDCVPHGAWPAHLPWLLSKAPCMHSSDLWLLAEQKPQVNYFQYE